MVGSKDGKHTSNIPKLLSSVSLQETTSQTPYGVKKKPNQRRLIDKFASPSFQTKSQPNFPVPSTSGSNLTFSSGRNTRSRSQLVQKSKIPKFDFQVVSHSFTKPPSKRMKKNEDSKSPNKPNNLGKSKAERVPTINNEANVNKNVSTSSFQTVSPKLGRTRPSLDIHVISPYGKGFSESSSDINLERHKPVKPLMEKNIRVSSRESSVASVDDRDTRDVLKHKRILRSKFSRVEEQEESEHGALSDSEDPEQTLKSMIREKPFLIPLDQINRLNAAVVPMMEVEVLSLDSISAVKMTTGRPPQKTKIVTPPVPDVDPLENVLLLKSDSQNRSGTTVKDLEVGLTVIMDIFSNMRKSIKGQTKLNALSRYESAIVKSVTATMSKVVELQNKNQHVQRVKKEIVEHSKQIGKLTDAKLKKMSS